MELNNTKLFYRMMGACVICAFIYFLIRNMKSRLIIVSKSSADGVIKTKPVLRIVHSKRPLE
jgi:hypothetical protein